MVLGGLGAAAYWYFVKRPPALFRASFACPVDGSATRQDFSGGKFCVSDVRPEPRPGSTGAASWLGAAVQAAGAAGALAGRRVHRTAAVAADAAVAAGTREEDLEEDEALAEERDPAAPT